MRLKDLAVAISALAALMVAMAIMRVVVTRPILLPIVGVWILAYVYVITKIYRHGMDVSLKPSRSELPNISVPFGRQDCGCFWFREKKAVLVEESEPVHKKEEMDASVEVSKGTADKYRCRDCGEEYYKNIEWEETNVMFWDDLDVDDIVGLNEID